MSKDEAKEEGRMVNVRMSPQDLLVLDDLAAREGTTVSDVVRRAIRAYAALDVPGRRPTRSTTPAAAATPVAGPSA